MAKNLHINGSVKQIVMALIFLVIGAVIYYIYYIFGLSQSPVNTQLAQQLEFHYNILRFCSSTSLVIVAVVGLYFTKHSIEESKKSSRQKLTIDLVFDTDQDKSLQDSKNLIFLLSQQDKLVPYYLELNVDISEVGFASSNMTEANRKKEIEAIIRENEQKLDELFTTFNHYENIAAGIRVGAFDEQLFKELHYSNFIKFWENIHPLVLVLRKRQDKGTLYQEMEWLYNKWKDDPIKKIIFVKSYDYY